ncbi:hypothetical protein ACFX15_030618 [Malus domestica]
MVIGDRQQCHREFIYVVDGVNAKICSFIPRFHLGWHETLALRHPGGAFNANNVVCCTGIVKDREHQFAAGVRSCKPPEVYKGNGIVYTDEKLENEERGKVDHYWLSMGELDWRENWLSMGGRVMAEKLGMRREG